MYSWHFYFVINTRIFVKLIIFLIFVLVRQVAQGKSIYGTSRGSGVQVLPCLHFFIPNYFLIFVLVRRVVQGKNVCWSGRRSEVQVLPRLHFIFYGSGSLMEKYKLAKFEIKVQVLFTSTFNKISTAFQ